MNTQIYFVLLVLIQLEIVVFNVKPILTSPLPEIRHVRLVPRIPVVTRPRSHVLLVFKSPVIAVRPVTQPRISRLRVTRNVCSVLEMLLAQSRTSLVIWDFCETEPRARDVHQEPFEMCKVTTHASSVLQTQHVMPQRMSVFLGFSLLEIINARGVSLALTNPRTAIMHVYLARLEPHVTLQAPCVYPETN